MNFELTNKPATVYTQRYTIERLAIHNTAALLVAVSNTQLLTGEN